MERTRLVKTERTRLVITKNSVTFGQMVAPAYVSSDGEVPWANLNRFKNANSPPGEANFRQPFDSQNPAFNSVYVAISPLSFRERFSYSCPF
jgi:hypothetical protein